MIKKQAFTAGQTIVVEMYPFVRTKFLRWDELRWDENGHWEDEGWRPGCDKDRLEDGQSDYAADALGAMLIEIVEVVKLPGGFSPRVFYVRRWRDPDGKEFGKRLCRVTTVGSLAKTVKGYRYPFYLNGEYVNLRCGIYPTQGDSD